MNSAFDLITLVAPDFGATCSTSSDNEASLQLPIKLVDGRTLLYDLHLQQASARVSVQERIPHHLPGFCPERHINSDGTFCLYYEASNPVLVTDEVSAREWVGTVYKFLKLQERARVRRKWPSRSAWAHGQAAHYQIHAQVAAQALGPKFLDALSRGALTLRARISKGRNILELLLDGTLIYSVWEEPERVINQRRRCFCNQAGRRGPRRIGRCHDHAKQAVNLALALRNWEVAENEYWESMQRRPCCDTCDKCPLKERQLALT